jgi:intein/homing endonuclease
VSGSSGGGIQLMLPEDVGDSLSFKKWLRDLRLRDFALLFGHIWEPELGRFEPWTPWPGVRGYPGQPEMFDALETAEIFWLLKTRQIAATTAVALLQVKIGFSEEKALMLVFNKDEKAAKAMLAEKVKPHLQSLELIRAPDGGSLPWPAYEIGKEEIWFEGDSVIQAMASTASGAISRVPRHQHWDEVREYEGETAAEMYASNLPVLNKGAQLALTSTNKPGTWFSKMSQTATMDWRDIIGKPHIEGRDERGVPYDRGGPAVRLRVMPKVTFMFMPYDVRPERRADGWYSEMQATYQDDAKFRREFCACVVGDTKISTDVGIVDIKYASGAKRCESGAISRWFVREPSPVLRIKTLAGRELTATHDHPIKMADGRFVNMGDVVVGDVVELRPPMFSSERVFVKWREPKFVEHSFEIDEDFGLLLGFFMGDGCYNRAMMSIACSARDPDVVEVVSDLMLRYVGRSNKYEISVRNGKAGCIEVRCGCVAMLEPLTQIDAVYRNSSGLIKRNVSVPPVIFKSPKSVVRQFLRGLFESDGENTAGGVRFSTNKEKFAQDVQMLLLGFGVTSTITERKRRDRVTKKQYAWYQIYVTTAASEVFMREIGFVGARKSERTFNVVHKLGRKRMPVGMTDEIISIEDAGLAETYDITVPESGVFSANGILTHNCPEDTFLTREGLVFPSFKARNTVLPAHLDGGLRWNSGDEFWLFYDHGRTKSHPALCWFIHYRPTLDHAHCFDEVYADEDPELPEVAASIMEKLEYWWREGAIGLTGAVGDVTGKEFSRRQQLTRSIAECLEEEMGIHWDPAFKHDFEGSLELARTRVFHGRFTIDPKRCASSIKQLTEHKFKDGTDRPSETMDESTDVLRYLSHKFVGQAAEASKGPLEKMLERAARREEQRAGAGLNAGMGSWLGGRGEWSVGVPSLDQSTPTVGFYK